MRRSPSNSGCKHEQGIIITLIAVFMLFVVGAMAALSIDVVTFYTARSEAQMAADGAALAAARVLANSGVTSSGGFSTTNPFPVEATKTLATNIATQVAQQNLVGGTSAQVSVTFFNVDPLASLNNPRVTVKVTRTDLPTFFARIWGTTTITVGASATAEAYNPSGLAGGSASNAPPVASTCVKPWLLPNIDPTNPSNPIFDSSTGAIQSASLLGYPSPAPPMDGTSLHVACPGGGDCSVGIPTPSPWQYLPANPSAFPPPASSSVSCVGSGFFMPYQFSVAGCVQTPVACNARIPIDLSPYSARDSETALAVDCLIHTGTSGSAGSGDSVDVNNSPPFEFLVGTSNPLSPGILNAGTDVLTSDSLVTVPVFDSRTPPTTSVQVIGFVQLFLQPNGAHVEGGGGPSQYMIRTTVINMVGCGTNLANSPAVPVYGNGPSAVPVRLISPSPAD